MNEQQEQSEQQEIQEQHEQQEHKPQESVSVFRNAREQRAKEAREKELAERQRQMKQAEEAEQIREAYAKELSEEKVDLIRLKQGVISESDKVFQEEDAPKKYTLWQKIGNWFYHSKWWLGIASFCVLVGGFLIFDYVTRKNPDVRLLMLTNHSYLSAKKPYIEELLSADCPDYNGDGEILSDVVYVPVSKALIEDASSAGMANSAKLSAQFQSAMCMLVLADGELEQLEGFGDADLFVNLEELYPQYDFIKGERVMLNDTNFAELVQLTEVPLADQTYLALRKPKQTGMESAETMQKAYDEAIPVLESLLKKIKLKGAS